MAASFLVVSCWELSPAHICVSVSGSVSDRARSPELFTKTAFTLCLYCCGESQSVEKLTESPTESAESSRSRRAACTCTCSFILNGKQVCAVFFFFF